MAVNRIESRFVHHGVFAYSGFAILF